MQTSLRGISKCFGPTLANDKVDLDLRPGRVTALLGENGAGKSTLMKILFGYYPPDSGQIFIDGRAVSLSSPRDAIACRIGMVFQRFSLIPALTVRENLAFAHPHSPWWLGYDAQIFADPLIKLREVAPQIDPAAKVSRLSVGELQLVELVKVLNLEPRLVILDEPTSVLAPSEAVGLWAQVKRVAALDVCVVFITHKLEDVFACAQDVVVMRRGRVVANLPVLEATPEMQVPLIVGEGAVPVTPHVTFAPSIGARTYIKGLSAQGASGAVHDVDLKIASGEILGIAGVSGNGQQTLADALAGLCPIQAGEVIVDGQTLQAPRAQRPAHPAIAYLPEQPLRNAVAPALSLTVNLLLRRISTLPFVPDFVAMRGEAQASMKRFQIRPDNPELAAESLSGGNLQKLVAARELSGNPALVIACYPSMGLDMTAAAAVYGALFALAQRGACVLWISEDLDDLIQYAHRIAVLARGRVVGIADARTATRRLLGAWMVGHDVRATARQAYV